MLLYIHRKQTRKKKAMTTYTVTIGTEIYREVTATTLKTMKKNNKNVKAVKEVTAKFWYYRNVQVLIHEEVSNGYTLVSAVDGSFFHRRATTTELEYR